MLIERIQKQFDCKMHFSQFLLVIDFFSGPGPLRLGVSPLVCHRECASESSAGRCQAFNLKLPYWTGPAGRSSGSDSDLGHGIRVVQDHDREPASERPGIMMQGWVWLSSLFL